jgi:hypothetical protein
VKGTNLPYDGPLLASPSELTIDDPSGHLNLSMSLAGLAVEANPPHSCALGVQEAAGSVCPNANPYCRAFSNE